MVASCAFEILKLRKRLSTWVLGGFLAISVGLFGYLFFYVLLSGVGPDLSSGDERLLTSLYPEGLVPGVLGVVSGLGGAISLTLGAMVVGGEYGWDTLKTALTQRPGRGRFFAGKLLAVAAVLAVFVVVSFAAGAGASYAVAAAENAPAAWPPVRELLLGAGAAWLILAAWASVGVFLATLFRGTTLAVGLGLIYALVLESLVVGVSFANEAVENVGRAMLGRNSTDLGLSFGEGILGGATAAQAADPAQAALVLVAYAVAATALSLLLFRRRDVV